MYEGDTFFMLAAGGQWALAVLSATLAFVAIGSVRLARRQIDMRAVAPAIGIVLWWLFLWLTPQLYYLLYMALLDDLPLQLVVGWPPGAERMSELLLFRGKAALSDHALGTLGWAMLVASLPRA